MNPPTHNTQVTSQRRGDSVEQRSNDNEEMCLDGMGHGNGLHTAVSKQHLWGGGGLLCSLPPKKIKPPDQEKFQSSAQTRRGGNQAIDLATCPVEVCQPPVPSLLVSTMIHTLLCDSRTSTWRSPPHSCHLYRHPA